MSWQVVLRPEAEEDIAEAATWYEDRQGGLAIEFIDEVLHVLDEVAENPFLNSRMDRLDQNAARASAKKCALAVSGSVSVSDHLRSDRGRASDQLSHASSTRHAAIGIGGSGFNL